MLAGGECRDSIKDSHANSDIFQEKETCHMRKHRSTLVFPSFEAICGLQAANTVKDQNTNQKVRPSKDKLECIYLLSNLFGTYLIFKLLFMMLKKKYHLLISILKHYKEKKRL